VTNPRLKKRKEKEEGLAQKPRRKERKKQRKTKD